MQTTIKQIEMRVLWKRYLTALRDEGIEGDIVEFGVFNGTGLQQLIAHSEELALKGRIYGFDSFEGHELVGLDYAYISISVQ